MIDQDTERRAFRARDQLDRIVIQNRIRFASQWCHDHLVQAKDKPALAGQASNPQTKKLIRDFAARIAGGALNNDLHLSAPEQMVEEKSERFLGFGPAGTSQPAYSRRSRMSYHLPGTIDALRVEKATRQKSRSTTAP
jgi:hypothetical protein